MLVNLHSAITPGDVRAILSQLDAELYDEAIPFEATARRMIAVSETVAEMIAANVTRRPERALKKLARSVGAVYRRDLLAAREFILEALDAAARAPG